MQPRQVGHPGVHQHCIPELGLKCNDSFSLMDCKSFRIYFQGCTAQAKALTCDWVKKRCMTGMQREFADRYLKTMAKEMKEAGGLLSL